MMKNTNRGGYLWMPAALLALLMGGCTAPVDQTDEQALDDPAGGAAEDVAGTSDALASCDGIGGCGIAGAAWSSWAAIPGIVASSVPSVAYWGGVPYMAYIGAGNQCFLTSYVNSAWASPLAIPGCFGPTVPNLAVYNNALYAGYLGAGGSCFLNAYGTAGWASPYALSGCGGAFAPVLAPYAQSLALVYAGAVDGLYFSTCAGLGATSWGYGYGAYGLGGLGVGGLGLAGYGLGVGGLGLGLGGYGVGGLGLGAYGCGAGALIPGVATPFAPALGVYDGTLALAYAGAANALFYTTLGVDGLWASPYSLAGAYATASPWFGYYNNALYLGYPSLYGGYAFAPFTGAGFGALSYLANPYAAAPFSFGYLGANLGWGAFALYDGALYGAYRTVW